MSKTSRKVLVGASGALLAMCVLLPRVFAASDTIDLTVTPTCPTRSITVTAAPEPYDFESVDLGLTTLSTRAVTVTNTASGCADTWSLDVAENNGGGATWNPGASPGEDVYTLKALFNATAPGAGDFSANDVVDGSAQACDAGSSEFTGSDICKDVANGNPQDLWFRLEMPTSTTASSPVTHTLTVTITTL